MTASPQHRDSTAEPPPSDSVKTVKVLVWDLDNTLWSGTLLEGDDVRLRPGVKETLDALDRRGILHSIASKNDADTAMTKLEELGVADYFLYPQIGWSAKSQSVAQIAESINIGIDTVAFIDDQPFEREEVVHVHPEVRTLDADELDGLSERADFIPRFITDESAIRRQMYQADVKRKQIEDEVTGPQEEFLAGLEMRFTLGPARKADLQRAEELTVRTHQLNTTGYTYSYDELAELQTSDDHLLLVADLVDRYGPYGKIGLALVEKEREVWRLKLLLMSCRVMSRGVGTIMLNHILALARDAGVRLLAEFRSNGRNRMMLVTYRFAGFKELERHDDLVVFENDFSNIQPFPDYVHVRLQS
ncbi:MAG: HAD-IIIC family phosphatase [Acidobacteriota bacterium]